jgi:spermidine/putrescine transport system permease protein
MVVIVFSFNAAQRGFFWEGYSARWYREVWGQPGAISALGNTLKVGVFTCALSAVFGLACGYVLALAQRRALTALTTAMLLPILVPDLIGSLSASLFYRYIGVPLGIHTIVLSESVFGIAYVSLFISVRTRSLRFRELLIAASMLGASPNRAFREVYVPMALPAVAIGVAVVGILVTQDFLYAFFCGGAGTTTLSVRLYSMLRFGANAGMNVIYTLYIGLAALAILLISRFGRTEVR